MKIHFFFLLTIPILQTSAKEIHLEKSKDIWEVTGVGVKYYSSFKFLNNKLKNKGTMFQATEPFKAENDWDLQFKFRFNGIQKHQNDGLGIWLTTSNDYFKKKGDDKQMETTFGYNAKKFSGVYVILKHDNQAKETNVWMDYVLNQEVSLKNLTAPMPKRLKCNIGWKTEDPNFEKNPFLEEVTQIMRHKEDEDHVSILILLTLAREWDNRIVLYGG